MKITEKTSLLYHSLLLCQLPAGDPAWFLNSFFHTDGGNNHANFASTAVDTLLDSLANAGNHADRVFLAGAVQGAIHEEVPVSNLVTPLWHVSINDNVQAYEPYGSDYYVIRADLRANIDDESGSHKTQAMFASIITMIGGCLLLW